MNRFSCFLTLLSVSVLLISCEKEQDSSSNVKETDNVTHSQLAKIGDPTLTVTVKCYTNRAIAERPRDGAECDCAACFGMCGCSVSGGISFLAPFNGPLTQTDEIPTLIGIEPDGSVVVYVSDVVDWS